MSVCRKVPRPVLHVGACERRASGRTVCVWELKYVRRSSAVGERAFYLTGGEGLGSLHLISQSDQPEVGGIWPEENHYPFTFCCC